MTSTPTVYVFHGTGSHFANSVFSSLEIAKAWISKHSLTGLLTAYTLDAPAFDSLKTEGKLPKWMRRNIDAGEPIPAEKIQIFVDGGEHYHFYYGLGVGSPGYGEASDRWFKENSGQAANE